MIKEKKCCFCGKIFVAGSNHIYACAKKNDYFLDKKEIKYMHITFNFPELNDSNLLYRIYVEENKSLPDIQKIYGIDFKSTLFLLDYFNIKKRNSHDGCILGAVKTRKSLFEKHGVINVGQLEEVKKKRKETCIKKFGVDNIYKYPPFYEYVKKKVEEKYGCTLSELQSKLTKKSWNSKSEEGRNNWLNNSIRKSRIHNKTGISNLEKSLQPMLNALEITYTIQFRINKSNGSCFYYDYFINDYNLIIEINGDYWHANPLIYKENDIIKYPVGYKKAGELWKKDLIKKELAEKKGFSILYIWESEMKCTDLSILLYEKLKEYENNKN